MSNYPAYPNLELIEYQFRQALNKHKEWKDKVEKWKKKDRHRSIGFDVTVFSQVWANTGTAFDICEDGTPAVSGQAFTKAYTVVIEETLTETYGVFVDGKPCYIVDEANDEFYKDFSERNLKSLSQAKKFY